MAKVEFDITVKGVGDVSLPVDTGGTTEVALDGLAQAQVPFSVTNTLDRPVNISNLQAVIDGPSKDKIQASLLATTLVISPGAIGQSTVTIESLQALTEADSATVSVLGSEGAIG